MSLTACPPQKKGDRPWWAPPSADGSKPKAKPKAKPSKPKPKAKAPAKSPAKPAKPASAPAAAAAPAEGQGQQELYDLGMKHYTEENYAEAKSAWQEVIRLGPNTPLAGQARENIKKTDQILKTLEEMKR